MTDQHIRFAISAPPDHHSAWQAAAIASGLDLSTWVGEQCNQALPKKVVAELSVRRKKGKRKKEGKDAV